MRSNPAQTATIPAVDVSIVVPTYREVENLGLLVPQIADALRDRRCAYEIIVVDDNSQDGTEALMAELAREHPVRLITRIGERGLSSAVIRGFREAQGRMLLCMDADLSHPPTAIPRLLDTIADPGVDFVIGSRYVAGGGTDQDWGLFRWLNSKVATLMARPFTSARDPMAGFFALRREVFARARDLNPIGYKIGLEIIVKAGCRNVREVPIQFADRRFGQSKLSFKEQLRYLRHLKRLSDYKYPVLSRFVQFCAVGGTGVAVDFAFYALLMRLLPVTVARALAIWVAMTWNFLLNRNFTFRDGRGVSALRQYPRFVASCLLGAFVSWSVAMGLDHVPLLTGRRFMAAFVGIVAGTLVNFFASLLWVFRHEKPAAEACTSSEPRPSSEPQPPSEPRPSRRD